MHTVLVEVIYATCYNNPKCQQVTIKKDLILTKMFVPMQLAFIEASQGLMAILVSSRLLKEYMATQMEEEEKA